MARLLVPIVLLLVKPLISYIQPCNGAILLQLTGQESISIFSPDLHQNVLLLLTVLPSQFS